MEFEQAYVACARRDRPEQALFVLKHPVVWLQGPPGSGKTTLIASYAAARGLRPIARAGLRSLIGNEHPAVRGCEPAGHERELTLAFQRPLPPRSSRRFEPPQFARMSFRLGPASLF
jgi:hypothetical protein